jgi:hypothetical protein
MRNKLLLIITLSIAILSGCKNDPCEGIECLNEGNCLNGECYCPDGYSGVNCEIFNPCHNVTCQNNGTCADGKCNCPEGYVGDLCEEESRAKFYGTYSMEGIADCGGSTEPFSFISIVGVGNEFSIITVSMDSSPLEAELDGNTFIIKPQLVNGTNYSGSGTFDGNTLSVVILSEYDGTNCTITASGTK